MALVEHSVGPGQARAAPVEPAAAPGQARLDERPFRELAAAPGQARVISSHLRLRARLEVGNVGKCGVFEAEPNQAEALKRPSAREPKETLGIDRRLGGAQPGNRFVSFVRAYARSGCLVELELNVCGLPFSLFPFCPGKLSLFPFGPGELCLFPSRTPQTSYPTLVGLIGII